jgi:hypothetical protein
MIHHNARVVAGAAPSDPYFKGTVLLLQGNGSNGGQNNTFIDDSSNSFSITKIGDVEQGSASPFSAPDGRWCVFFDGSGDYITIDNNSALDFGSSDFTIEAWINLSGVGALQQIVAKNSGFPDGYEFNFSVSTSGKLSFLSHNTSFYYVEQDGFLPLNEWVHVAAVRSGSSIKLYVNGVLKGTVEAQPIKSTGANLTIGRDLAGGNFFRGLISNLRIINGTALYTSNFAPSTSPLTPAFNTVLLTCQSSRFLDKSAYSFDMTVSGNVAVLSYSPFTTASEYRPSSNGGSSHFNGGSYLSLPSNAALNFGSSDFTVEAWVHSTSTTSDAIVFLSGLNNGYAGFRLSPTYLLLSTDGSSWLFTDAVWSLKVNSWNHLAVTRSGSTVRVFVNGSMVVTKTVSGSLYSSGSQYTIGRYQENISTFYYFRGFLSSLRFIKGAAQYTANFTVPTTPHTAIANTSLLLNFTNASVLDSTARNIIKTHSNAQISTGVKKHGSGSLYLTAFNDALVSVSNPVLIMGTGDHTIEFWYYRTRTENFTKLFATDQGGGPTSLQLNNNVPEYVSNYSNIATGTEIALNSWTHIAVTRSGNTIRLFQNGVLTGSGTDSSEYYNSRIIVGNEQGLDAAIVGYIDDFRVTRGVARYTANFTPPSSQLPAR